MTINLYAADLPGHVTLVERTDPLCNTYVGARFETQRTPHHTITFWSRDGDAHTGQATTLELAALFTRAANLLVDYAGAGLDPAPKQE